MLYAQALFLSERKRFEFKTLTSFLERLKTA